jgi:hypothetical protein
MDCDKEQIIIVLGLKQIYHLIVLKLGLLKGIVQTLKKYTHTDTHHIPCN